MELDDDAPEFDHEAQEWFAQKERARARSTAARAGNPALDIKNRDEINRQQMLRDQEAVRAAAITPGSLTGAAEADPFAFPSQSKVSVPVPTSIIPATATAPVPAQAANHHVVYWTSLVGGQDNIMLYSDSWDELKTKLKAYPGNWTATEHKFLNTPKNVLGFFVPTQHKAPENSVQKTFEIIVANDKVFKAES